MKGGQTQSRTRVASPLRWAGGKRWLLPGIEHLIDGVEINDYHEPFLGGGSIFLGLPPFANAFLSDTNAELIDTFEAIRDAPEEVAEQAHQYANDADTYYEVRASEPTDAVARAGRFLYLNHTSFNGIYRVNLTGVYNVPFGHRSKTHIPSVDHLRAVADRLKSASLYSGDFAEGLERVGPNDLVFLDPPYTVAHNNNGFVKYNQRLFSFDDQRRLSKMVDKIRERDAYYVLANAAHQSIAELFRKGDTLLETSRRNAIGGAHAARGSATEYLFTNLL